MQTLEQIAEILNQAAEVSRAEIKRVFTKEKNERRLHAYYNDCRTVTVRGGFPVLVWMDIRDAEPDVGYHNPIICEWELSTTNFGSIRFLGLTEYEQRLAMEKAYDDFLCSR